MNKDDFKCPITQDYMVDPVIALDGITYERTTIEAWFAAGHRTSPKTRQALTATTLTPNVVLRSMIDDARRAGLLTESDPMPPPPVEPDAPRPPLTATTQRIAGTNKLLITLSVPEAPDATLPLTCIGDFDVSGSMGSPSVDTSTNTSDAAQFSRADLVRHSFATQIELLRPKDKSALVLFDNNADVALPITQMTATGRTTAKTVLNQISPRGGTNIWTGLQRALTLAKSVDTTKENVAIILQTDGESDPNYNPPRGIAATFRSWMDSNPDVHITLHTVGYGYGKALDMPLLRELATIGNGTVSYIADGSMVGTVFIHLLANLMSVVYRGLTLQIPEIGFAERVGFIQSGQTRHFVVELPEGHTGDLTVAVRDTNGPVVETTVSLGSLAETTAPFALARQSLLTTLKRELVAAEANSFLNGRCLDSLCVGIAAAAPSDLRIVALLADLRDPDPNKGQISKAFGSASAFQRWGRHYIPWVISSHENEWAINFKDASSLSAYGSDTTRRLVERGDGIFTTLPPPTASCAHVARGPQLSSGFQFYTQSPGLAPLASLASVHSSAGPCFLGASTVLMADGTHKRCDQIQPGDIAAPDYKVRCVIKTLVPHANIVQLGTQTGDAGGFTLWHPVYVDGKWQHPADIGKIQQVATDAIYNFVLETGHVLLINGIMTCTMAHDLTANEVIDHPYFGKRRPGIRNIMDDLSADPGWAAGYIVWKNVQVEHDATTGFINGMRSS
jgi:hypothetical protein